MLARAREMDREKGNKENMRREEESKSKGGMEWNGVARAKRE